MATKNAYRTSVNINNEERLKQLLSELPNFLRDFFRGIESNTASTTRLSYATDLRIFFRFLTETNPLMKNRTTQSITLDEFASLEPVDIEEFLEYLKVYEDKGQTFTNDATGKSRKLSTLRSTYRYFTSHKIIQSNPAEIVNSPKIEKKNILRLDQDEMVRLIHYMHNVESTLSGQRLAYFRKTKYRDIAIVTLLLGTGIRVSELVGLDVQHVDFINSGISIVRKGGNETIVYFGEEVYEALNDYISITRDNVVAVPGHENALFYSTRRKRISVDAVENLVVKYTAAIAPIKHITPHKLRSSYGSALYNATGDLYLTADVLGHKSVETTRRHYADIDDDRRKSAGSIVTLK